MVMRNPSSNPFDLPAYPLKSARELSVSERHSVESDDERHLLCAVKRGHGRPQSHTVKGGAACVAVGILANIIVGMTPGTELVSSAHAQAVPKSLEQGGADAELRQRRNAWTVGVVGGILSGTYMTFADELAQVLNDGDNLRIIPMVSNGAASNLDDLLYLRGVDVVMTQSDVFEYFRTQRKTPNLENRIHYIMRLPVSEMHLLAGTDIKSIEDLRGKKVSFEPDRDDRISTPGCAGRAGDDGQCHRAAKAQIGRTCRTGADYWQADQLLRADSGEFRSSSVAHSLF